MGLNIQRALWYSRSMSVFLASVVAVAFAPTPFRANVVNPSLRVPSHISLSADEFDGMDLDEYAEKIKSNLFEGDFGTRGEAWVAGQALLVGCVAAAPDLPGVRTVSILLGLIGLASGGALATGAAVSLGGSLTPWPKPVETSSLKEDGVYSLCRHPIYSGLIAGCGGVSLLSASYERLLFTALLTVLLSAKADREEEFLNDKHIGYQAYSGRVPKLLPEVGAMLTLLRSS